MGQGKSAGSTRRAFTSHSQFFHKRKFFLGALNYCHFPAIFAIIFSVKRPEEKFFHRRP
jgi:hypothetical protein